MLCRVRDEPPQGARACRRWACGEGALPPPAGVEGCALTAGGLDCGGDAVLVKLSVEGLQRTASAAGSRVARPAASPARHISSLYNDSQFFRGLSHHGSRHLLPRHGSAAKSECRRRSPDTTITVHCKSPAAPPQAAAHGVWLRPESAESWVCGQWRWGAQRRQPDGSTRCSLERCRQRGTGADSVALMQPEARATPDIADLPLGINADVREAEEQVALLALRLGKSWPKRWTA